MHGVPRLARLRPTLVLAAMLLALWSAAGSGCRERQAMRGAPRQRTGRVASTLLLAVIWLWLVLLGAGWISDAPIDVGQVPQPTPAAGIP